LFQGYFLSVCTNVVFRSCWKFVSPQLNLTAEYYQRKDKILILDVFHYYKGCWNLIFQLDMGKIDFFRNQNRHTLVFVASESPIPNSSSYQYLLGFFNKSLYLLGEISSYFSHHTYISNSVDVLKYWLPFVPPTIPAMWVHENIDSVNKF
jgi:hypothetical protein